MKLPPIGFGCSPIRAAGRRLDLEEAIGTALGAGYRLLDTAELYGNERAVGRVLRRPGAPPRSAVTLVGKVWRTHFRPAALIAACEASLLRLGVDAFDLYLLHAPEAWHDSGPLGDPEVTGWEEHERRAVGNPEPDDVPLPETWAAMEELVKRGLAGRIGVSNFSLTQIDALPDLPAANQIAWSPVQPDRETAAWCRERGIMLMAHSPLSAPAGLFGDPIMIELSGRHGCAPAQILLRWTIQHGLVPLPSSSDPSHVVDNLRALEIELDAAEMAAIDSLR